MILTSLQVSKAVTYDIGLTNTSGWELHNPSLDTNNCGVISAAFTSTAQSMGIGDNFCITSTFTIAPGGSSGSISMLRLVDQASPSSSIRFSIYHDGAGQLGAATTYFDDGSLSSATTGGLAAFSTSTEYNMTLCATRTGTNTYDLDFSLVDSNTGIAVLDSQDGNTSTGSTLSITNAGFDASNFLAGGTAGGERSVCFAPVPEPSSAMLASLAGLCALIRRRR